MLGLINMPKGKAVYAEITFKEAFTYPIASEIILTQFKISTCIKSPNTSLIINCYPFTTTN